MPRCAIRLSGSTCRQDTPLCAPELAETHGVSLTPFEMPLQQSWLKEGLVKIYPQSRTL